MMSDLPLRLKDKSGRFVDWLLWHGSSSSTAFWRRHYKVGGTSGPGSYGPLADYKAMVVNDIIAEFGIESVIELGCGDSNQLGLLLAPRYVGLDISASAIERCIARYEDDRTKSFFLLGPTSFHDPGHALRQDLSLSMDVIFHLVEDSAFEHYMRTLFEMSRRCVVIYSSNKADSEGEPRYTRHRAFTTWVERNISGWRLDRRLENPFAEITNSAFYVFLPDDTTAARIDK